MYNKLEELKQKFDCENNTTGSRLADALNRYLEEFTGELETRMQKEREKRNEPPQKVVNCMIPVDQRERYMQKHMYPVLPDENMLVSEADDPEVLNKMNKKIREINKEAGGNGARTEAAYVYMELTLKQLVDFMDSEEYKARAIDRDGKVYEVPYYLCWSELVINKLREIWNLTKLYGGEVPIVYAPYSTRLFRIEIDLSQCNLENEEIEHFDFRLAENGIGQYVKCSREMMWNVKFDAAGVEMEPLQVPVGDVIKWKYQFEQVLDHQYIVPFWFTDPTLQVKRADNKTIHLEFENLNRSGFLKVTIPEIDERELEGTELFCTNYNREKLEIQQRVRSISDIKYELSKFYKDQRVSIETVYEYEPQNVRCVAKYPHEMSIYERGRFRYKNTNRVYIKFTGEVQYIFFEDYANFVLGVLTYLFPEIGWEGVV